MADTFTLTGDLATLIGGDFAPRTLSARIESNAAGGVIAEPDAGKVHLGGLKLDVAPDGTFTVAGLLAEGDLQYQVIASYVDPGAGKPITKPLGWWPHPLADAVIDLSTRVTTSAAPPAYDIPAALADTLAARDDAETAAASVQREQPNGVAGLDAAGKLFEPRIPDRLSDASLSATYVLDGSAFADIAKQAGVDNTGVTECAAAIQTALDGFVALGVRAYAEGTFKTASEVTITGNADLGDATFSYEGAAGTAVTVQPALSTRHITTPKITDASKPGTGWRAGITGLAVVNALGCEVHVTRVDSFETGLLVLGDGAGCSYNTFHIGYLFNNKRNLQLDGINAGWSNQNTYFGGRFAHLSAEGSAVAGTRHILLSEGSGSVPNGNTFVGCSLEGAGSPGVLEYTLEIEQGTYNQFINCRWENAPNVYFGSTGACAHNRIVGGYSVTSIVATYGAASVFANHIIGASNAKQSFSGENGGVIYDSSTGGTAAVMSVLGAGGIMAGHDVATQYVHRVDATMSHWKQTANAADRIRVHTNGGIYFGDGVSVPAQVLRHDNSGLSSNVALVPADAQTGTVSLGGSGNRWQHLFTSGMVEFNEMTAPATPAADRARLYVKDNGAGKTQLVVKFSDDVEIVLATQA